MMGAKPTEGLSPGVVLYFDPAWINNTNLFGVYLNRNVFCILFAAAYGVQFVLRFYKLTVFT